MIKAESDSPPSSVIPDHGIRKTEKQDVNEKTYDIKTKLLKSSKWSEKQTEYVKEDIEEGIAKEYSYCLLEDEGLMDLSPEEIKKIKLTAIITGYDKEELLPAFVNFEFSYRD